jgi:AcrR family transcriptional regulator
MSVTSLAQRLELKRPTLLYHFKSYAEIVVVALESLLIEQTAFLLSRINKHDHPIDRLYARVVAVHEYHRDQEERIVFLSQAIATLGRERMADIFEVGNRVFEAHRNAQALHVREGIEQGTVLPCDVDALMTLIRSVTDGLLIQRVVTGAPYEPVHEFLWQHILLPLKVEPTRDHQGKL